MAERDDSRKSGGAGSSRKVLAMLFSFDERRTSATVADLAEVVDAPMPSAYRYVALLKELRLLEETGPGRYSPSARVIPLARAAQLSNPAANIALPVMESMVAELHETIMLMQYAGDQAVCIQAVESDKPMRYTFQPGNVMPLGRGASGKMLLASMPRSRRDAWLDEHDAGGALRREIDEIAESGHSTSSGELFSGVWACSVPVSANAGRPIVLSVAGPASRISDTARLDVRDLLRRGAADIRADLARLSW